MSNFEKNLRTNRFVSESVLGNLNFVVAAIGVMFLFRDCLGILKLLVFFYGGVAFLFYRGNFADRSEIYEFKKYFIPWIPWFVGLVALCLVHGGSGFSKYYNAYAIMFCLLIFPSRYIFERLNVFLICAAFCSIISISALYQMLACNPGVIVLGDKKNTLFGGITLLTVLSTCALFDDSEKIKKYRLLFSTTVAIALICIAVSEMRTALVGIGVALFVLLITKRKTNKHAIAFLVSAFILFALAYLFSGRLMEGINDLKQLAQGNSNSSWGIRVELWKLAAHAFLEKPFFGWGASPIDKVLASGVVLPDGIPNVGHFHNDLLESIVMGGMVGFSCLLGTIVLLIKRADKDLAMMVLLVTMISIGLFERYWFDQHTLFLFCCLLVMLFKSKTFIYNNRHTI